MTIDTAINTLVSEYDLLDGSVSISAGTRRTLAMEQVTAVMFSTITADQDPYGVNDRDGTAAGETLRFVCFVAEQLVSAMLDCRALLAKHGYNPANHTVLLRQMLLEIWAAAREDPFKPGE